MTRRGLRSATTLTAALLVLGLSAAPAASQDPPGDGGSSFGPAPSAPPPTTREPQRRDVTPQSAPARTCSVYASSSGFGLLCSDAAAGRPLAVRLGEAGISTDRFCWDDPDLPDGFDPAGQGAQPDFPGAWWLQTCLTFDNGSITRTNARLSYEYVYRATGTEDELTPAQEEVITSVTGRGQIPYLQVQTSPIASPRVGQDVAFSMLCTPEKVLCRDTPEGRRIETPRLRVGGVVMHAELVHLRVLPTGSASDAVDCRYAGLERTAEQLDAGPEDDPRVCRHRYERSSDGAGSGTRGDRFPSRVTAYWQVFVDDGSGPEPFRDAYEKTSTNLVRVTEVQTLVVS